MCTGIEKECNEHGSVRNFKKILVTIQLKMSVVTNEEIKTLNYK